MGTAGASPVGSGGVPAIEFGLLGPLELRVHGEPVPIHGHRLRVVLAMLLLEPGRVMTVARLSEAIWDRSPPRTADAQVQICISQLRKLLAAAGEQGQIRTHPGGYLIDVGDDMVDVGRFRALVTAGGASAAEGQPAAGAARLRAALDLWRGDVAADVHSQIVQAAALRLNEERLAVEQEWLALELEVGRHDQHIGDLSELVASHPLREKAHALLALALYRAGRQAEALTVCRQARRVLIEEHGIDPGEELRELERAILSNDPRLAVRTSRAPAVVPRQLPAAPPGFVGRDDSVAAVCEALASAGSGRLLGPRIVTISGAAGVGKSALAVYAAYQVQQSYPDGQLYTSLRGTDTVPVAPEQVLNQFLRALGAQPATLPNDVDELTGMYRSWTADRRVLILLDDAAGDSQVRPLIPTGPGCGLVVTSRRALVMLTGSHRVFLEELDPSGSLALLTTVIGQPRVRAEPEAAAEFVTACGHLPLALQVAAAKLSAKSHWQVAQMVSRLRDERRRLDELTLDDVGVRPSIAASYRVLEPPAARLLPLLSLLGAVDFGGWVAGPLLGSELDHAVDALDQLVEARLVEVHTGAGQRTRYRLHDLTRIFAREKLVEESTAAERAEAQHRLLRCWLFLTRDAHRREFRGDYLILHSGVGGWPMPPKVTDDLLADPMRWLQSEYANLVSAVSLAAQLMLDDLCWDLAVTSVTLFETRAYYTAWRETHEVAMDAAVRAGNARGQAVLRYSRGGLALAEKRLTDAQHDLALALAWFDQAADGHGHGLTLRNLASIARMQGRYDEALRLSEAALTDLRPAGDRVAEATTLRILGQTHLECRRLDEAEARLREGLAVCAEVGGRRIEAQVRYWLGEVLLERGRPAPAEEAFQAVLGAAEEIGDVVGRAMALVGLASVQLAHGSLGPAEVALRDALAAARSGGSRLPEGRALLALAEVRLRWGDSSSATAAINQAEEIFREIGASRWVTRAEKMRRRWCLAPPDAGSEQTATGRIAGQ